MAITIDNVSRALRRLERVSPPLASELAFALWMSTGRRKRVHPLERVVMQLATTSSLRLGRRRIAVYTWGNGPKPVLLVHGWQGRAAEFASIVRELRAQDRTVIAFDAPAHGASSGRRTDIREFAEIIALLEQRFGGFEAIVAHSFGSPAAALALRQGVRAGRLVSIGGVAEMEYLPEQFARVLRLNAVTVRGLRSRIEGRLFRGIPDVWNKFSSNSEPLPADIPLLIVHDTDDTVVEIGQAMAFAAAHESSATVLTTTGLGHHRILRDNAVLDAVADFVENAAATRAAVPVPG